MEIIDLIEEGKIKRIFRVRNKLIFPGAIVHITQRATGKEPLFIEEADYLQMLHLIKEKANKFFLEIFSFVLMSNHLHILLRLKEANLSEAAKSLFGAYANFFNQKYERKGHLFCGPYGEALYFDESYFLSASLYIHINPCAAGLVKEPTQYRWSSCGLFVESRKRKSFINYEFILKVLDEDMDKARGKYRELLDQSMRLKIKNVQEDKWDVEKFRIKVLKFLPFKKEWDVFDEEELDKKIGELKGKGRLRNPQALAARKFLIEQLLARGYTISEITIRLNLSRPSVYFTLNFTNK